MRNWLLLIGLWCWASGVFAQQSVGTPTDAKGIIYNREQTFELFTHTNGMLGIGFTKAKIKTYYKTTFYTVDISQLYHIKEYRQNPDFPQWTDGTNSRPFVFGKQNSLWVVRAGWGKKTYLSEKSKVKGVAIGYTLSGGGSVGLLKPYYLNLIRYDDAHGRPYLSSEKYSEENAAVFLDQSRIYGADAFSKGWSEVRPLPGAYGRLGLLLDWGAFDQFAKALEIGVMADVYLAEVPLMLTATNRPYFVNFYARLSLGKRY